MAAKLGLNFVESAVTSVTSTNSVQVHADLRQQAGSGSAVMGKENHSTIVIVALEPWQEDQPQAVESVETEAAVADSAHLSGAQAPIRSIRPSYLASAACRPPSPRPKRPSPALCVEQLAAVGGGGGCWLAACSR